MDTLFESIVRHIVNVYNKLNENKIEFGEVLNKFEHLLSNENLCSINESTISKLFSRMIKESEIVDFVNNGLFGVLNEGFYNPFGDEDYDTTLDNDYIKNISVSGGIVLKDRDNCPIKSIKKWDTNVNGKIYCKGKGRMYSGVRFIPGDIVEECPVDILRKDAMFSRDLRDYAFQVYPDKEIYAFPLGYANCYATDADINKEGNIDYEYNPDDSVIRFYAISDIKRGDMLILRTGENFIN